MTRRLIMWNLITLDGFFEGETKWSLDHHAAAWGPDLAKFVDEQLREVGALVFGRTTYEGMYAHWSKATGAVAEGMNALPKIVASRTMTEATWNNSRIARDGVAEVRAAKAEDGKDLYVFGSADLSASLMAANLFDEYRLCIAPIVLGKGTPMFREAGGMHKLELLDARTVDSGAVIVRYAPRG